MPCTVLMNKLISVGCNTSAPAGRRRRCFQAMLQVSAHLKVQLVNLFSSPNIRVVSIPTPTVVFSHINAAHPPTCLHTYTFTIHIPTEEICNMKKCLPPHRFLRKVYLYAHLHILCKSILSASRVYPGPSDVEKTRSSREGSKGMAVFVLFQVPAGFLA